MVALLSFGILNVLGISVVLLLLLCELDGVNINLDDQVVDTPFSLLLIGGIIVQNLPN